MEAMMRRIRRMIIGALVSAALLGGAAGAAVAAVSSAPTGVSAATAIEY
jgi:hypothetical protein